MGGVLWLPRLVARSLCCMKSSQTSLPIAQARNQGQPPSVGRLLALECSPTQLAASPLLPLPCFHTLAASSEAFKPDLVLFTDCERVLDLDL